MIWKDYEAGYEKLRNRSSLLLKIDEIWNW